MILCAAVSDQVSGSPRSSGRASDNLNKQNALVLAEELIFNNPEPIERGEAMAILGGNDSDAIADTLVALALHDPGGEWIEELCWRMAEHPDPSVRGLAGLCLGHVARRFGVVRPLSWEVVRALCDDPDVDNRPCAGLDDMRMFAGPER